MIRYLSMREKVRDKGRLKHILAAIDKIEEYTDGMSKQKLATYFSS